MMKSLVGKPPTVGIVAHIDPRTYPVSDIPEGSVRASQLPLVLARLRQVVELAESLTLWDGSRLKVVMASTPVGGPREAAIVQKEFEEAGVDCVVHSMCTWSMGWETQFFGHPDWLELLEAKNGTAWPGAVLQNSLRASATAHQKPVWCSYPPDVEGLAGQSDDLHPVSVANITAFLKCAAARAMMRGKSYASIGHVSMGIAGSEGLSDIYARYFGMKFCHIDQVEVAERLNHGMYDKEEAQRAVEWFFNNFRPGLDPEGKRATVKVIRKLIAEKLVPMTLIVRDILRGNDAIKDPERANGFNALLGGTAGQRYWTDWHPNWDFTEAILSSMFDWNGDRPPITLATENDGLNGMSMLWGTMISGVSSLFADLRTYWSPEVVADLTGADIKAIAPTGFLHLINSGPAAMEWATDPLLEDVDVRRQTAIENVEWHPAELGYFPNDGLSTHFCTPGNIPVTMIRFNRVGSELTISVIEGNTIDPGKEVAELVRANTNPTWPDTFVVAEGVDLGEIMINGASIGDLKNALARYVSTKEVMERGIDPNHVALGAGHIGREILLLASMLRIPVDFTNVVDPWRPTLWTRLGGDFRACEKLGPLYK